MSPLGSGVKAWSSRLPAAGAGDMVMATVKKDKAEFGKKVQPGVVISPQKSFWRKMVCSFTMTITQGPQETEVNDKGRWKFLPS